MENNSGLLQAAAALKYIEDNANAEDRNFTFLLGTVAALDALANRSEAKQEESVTA